MHLILNMSTSSDIISSFTARLCTSFGGKCPKDKCALVRKIKEKIKDEGDFCVTLNRDALNRHSTDISSANDIDQKNLVESALELISSNMVFHRDGVLEDSSELDQEVDNERKEWPLQIEKCVAHINRLSIYLHRTHTYQIMLHHILSHNSFGKCHKYSKVVLLPIDTLATKKENDLSDYRIHIIKEVLRNLLVETGYSIMEDENMKKSDGHTLCANVNLKQLHFRDTINIHCGRVIISGTECKGNASVEEYLRHKCENLKKMSYHKYGEQIENDENMKLFLRQLGEASLRMDLLNKRPSNIIIFSLQALNQDSKQGAPFILYNCARIAAIRHKYQNHCSEGKYPELPPLDRVDFSLLVKEDEWELLSCYLMTYPCVVQSTVEHFEQGRPLPNLLCFFLSSLCCCYSRYYRHVRILTEPREHLLPVLFARLYLLQAIECVLHNGLRLLGIEPLNRM